MPRLTGLITGLALAAAAPVHAGGPAPGFTFPSIDGGSYATAQWRGKPVLVVNTASLCGFTPQYDDLQALSDAYQGRAVVLAVPSDDFNQELGSDKKVRDFCDANFNLTLPMSTIQHVAKGDLHPFYAWVKETQGFTPGWNFNKVLIAPDGSIAGTFGAPVRPEGPQIAGRIEAMLE